jgi:hypothetical protein
MCLVLRSTAMFLGARLTRNWVGPSFGMRAAEKEKIAYYFWE